LALLPRALLSFPTRRSSELWEFGHRGDPAEDVAWPLVRAWRFGVDELHLGGIGEVEPYLERYNVLTGRHITLASLGYWEIVGNLDRKSTRLNSSHQIISYAA